MSYYDDIFDEAIGNYGLISSSRAAELGVPVRELVKIAHRGKLRRIGQGVYKLVRYAPSPDGLDSYAEAVAIAGKDAFLYGESVLAMHRLCPTNPARIWAATPRRVRKRPVPGVVILANVPCTAIEWHEGIPRQPIPDAIAACTGSIMPQRLRAAAAEAARLGLISAKQRNAIAKGLP